MNGEAPEDNMLVEEDLAQSEVVFHEYNHDSVFQEELTAEQLSLSIQNNKEDAEGIVITSYSIHYTKLYEVFVCNTIAWIVWHHGSVS